MPLKSNLGAGHQSIIVCLGSRWPSGAIIRFIRSSPMRFTLLACLLPLAFGLASCKRGAGTAASSPSDQFLSLMNAGKNYMDQGDATNALVPYKKAQALMPNDADLRLNLANCYLLAG